MIVSMFQCQSPISFYPCPLPQSPKDCSIHLCLFCCLAYRVIITFFLNSIYMHSVQFSCSVVSGSLRSQACQASLSITNSRSSLKLTSIKSMMPSNHLILCHSLLLPPSIFPSIRVFSNESVLRIRWPKYWSFSFNLSPSTSVLPMNTQD